MKKVRGQEIVRLALGGPLDDRPSLRSISAAIGLPVLLALALPVGPLWARGALALGIVLLAMAGLALRRGPPNKPSRWVTIDGARIARTDESGEVVLASFGAPFGVTVLSNHARTRALLAFTTPEQTRYVRVRVHGPEEATRVRELLARASTVTEADALLGADADGDALSATAALRLLHLVGARAPGALERCYLTDSRGGQVVLDGDELRLGERTVDLRAPLEWRGFMFHESLGHLTTIYQATWLRQSATEAVLVAPLPSEVTSWMVGRPKSVGAVTRDAIVQRALVRDLRLMQSLPDVPPPREQRVAIERLFMLTLRGALDRAPRLARASVPPSRTVPGQGMGAT